MSIAQALLDEFETQAPVTHRFLERLPEGKLHWKPHARSMSAGQLALHLATVPGSVVRLVEKNPGEVPASPNFPQPGSLEEILQAFEASIAAVRAALAPADNASMSETWRLMSGGRQLLCVPRAQFLRDVMLSHWYQHRGQFSVYLRILDVPVPASWGPSADEPPHFAERAQVA